jgi:AmmeMemoRadiSam system protein B
MVEARQPAAAGVFYPSERGELERVVRDLLEATRPQGELPPSQPTRRGRRVRAIVVPHGLYATAGATIAAAWAQVATSALSIRRVVLLGPAHHLPFAGVAAPFADAFATPLGLVAVDRIAIETARRLPQLVLSDVPHEQEHSLEVQLPFVQIVLPAAMIVPLIVGESSVEEGAAVLDALWDDSTLAVVSTDLSQYYDDLTARRLDENTARSIEAAQYGEIGEEQACGHAARRALLFVTRARGMHAMRVAMCHAGEKDEVIGFGAFVVM